MTEHPDTEVLIAGAGPTGLAAAIELRRRGVDCRVVEKNSRAVESSRALAIQPRTLQAFDDMGVLGPVLDEGFRVTGARVYEGDTEIFRLDMDALSETPYPFLWWLPQNRTERILLDRLADLGVDVAFERELTGFGQRRESVTARVKDAAGGDGGEEITARWLLGCDGAHSRVRRTLGRPMQGVTTAQELLVADVTLDWDRPSAEGAIWLHEHGVVAALPMLGEGNWRVFVDVTPVPKPYRPEAEGAVIQRSLRERTSHPDLTVTGTLWTSTYVANQRMVESYRHGRVFLAGDAAHVHNPFGGQGMNLGIQDAYNLAWKLALVEQDRAPERLLDTYDDERIPVAEAVVQETGVSGSLLLTKSPVIRRIRDELLPVAVDRTGVQRRLYRSISMLETHYRDSSLSRVDVQSPLGGLVRGRMTDVVTGARREWTGPKAGDRAPNVTCRRRDGTETSLYGLAHERPTFTLLLLTGSGPADPALEPIARAVDPDLIRPVLVVSQTGNTADIDDATVVVDDAQFHERYGATQPTLFLLRPDDYVALRAQPPRTAPLDAYTREWLTHDQQAPGD